MMIKESKDLETYYYSPVEKEVLKRCLKRMIPLKANKIRAKLEKHDRLLCEKGHEVEQRLTSGCRTITTCDKCTRTVGIEEAHYFCAREQKFFHKYCVLSFNELILKNETYSSI
jgi:hypothetical protein